MRVEQQPVSKVLLDGLYDADCLLSQLRGCQHVMKVIWEKVVEEKRKAVAKLGRTVEEVVATTPRQVGYLHIGILFSYASSSTLYPCE